MALTTELNIKAVKWGNAIIQSTGTLCASISSTKWTASRHVANSEMKCKIGGKYFPNR